MRVSLLNEMTKEQIFLLSFGKLPKLMGSCQHIEKFQDSRRFIFHGNTISLSKLVDNALVGQILEWQCTKEQKTRSKFAWGKKFVRYFVFPLFVLRDTGFVFCRLIEAWTFLYYTWTFLIINFSILHSHFHIHYHN